MVDVDDVVAPLHGVEGANRLGRPETAVAVAVFLPGKDLVVVEDGDLGRREDEATAQGSETEGDVITPVREDLLQSARLALCLGEDVNIVALLVETADFLSEDGQLSLHDTRLAGAEAHGGVHLAQRRRAQPPTITQPVVQPIAVARQQGQRQMRGAVGVALPITA